jgi:hypothetical protein
LGLTALTLEGDSLEVIQAMKKDGRNGSRYGPILEEVKALLSDCRWWELSHVRRTGNEVVHRLAKMAVSFNVNQSWFTTIASCIKEIVMAETIVDV